MMSKSHSSQQGKGEIFSILLLSFVYAAYFLWLNIAAHIQGGISEKEESLIFLHGWITVPILTLSAVRAVDYFQKKFFNENQIFYPVLLFVNAVYVLISAWLLRLSAVRWNDCGNFGCVLEMLNSQLPSWETAKFFGGYLSLPLCLKISLLFPVLNVITLLVLKPFNKALKETWRKNLSLLCYTLLPFMIGCALVNFSSLRFENSFLVKAVIFLALLSFFHQKFIALKPNKTIERAMDAAAIVFILFLIFDPALPIERHHQNHYLGPVNDMFMGKSPLVDINCQYGVLVLYFLKLIFCIIPISYQGLSLFIMILTVFYYSLIYILLKQLLKSFLFSFVVLLLIIETNFFATLGDASAYPSIGPFRFGIPYALLLFVMGRAAYPKRAKIFKLGEYALIGITAVWSMETFVYALAAYLAVLAYEAFCYSLKWKEFAFKMIKQLLILSAAVIFAYFVMTLSIYLSAKTYPHWEYYFDYILLYSTKEFGTMLVAPFSPWIFAVFIPLASFLILVHARNSSGEFTIAAGLTGMSIAQFTYYLGRSHPNNLFHISVPLIILVSFWMVHASRRRDFFPKRFYPGLIYGCYFALFFLSFSLWPRIAEKTTKRLNNYSKFKENISLVEHPKPSNESVSEAMSLIEKYKAKDKRVGIFLEADDATEALILSRKTHVFPVSFAIQDFNLPSARQRAVDFKHPLKEKDIIFVSHNCADIHRLILHKLQQEFKFMTIERTPHELFAIELGKYGRTK